MDQFNENAGTIIANVWIRHPRKAGKTTYFLLFLSLVLRIQKIFGS